jgi:hypothetical protein
MCNPVNIYSRSFSLLGRCYNQLWKSCASVNIVYSQTELVFILEHSILTKFLAKYQIRQHTHSGNKMSGHKKCLLQDGKEQMLSAWRGDGPYCKHNCLVSALVGVAFEHSNIRPYKARLLVVVISQTVYSNKLRTLEKLKQCWADRCKNWPIKAWKSSTKQTKRMAPFL